MLRKFRQVVRIALIAVWTLGAFGLWVLFTPLIAVSPRFKMHFRRILSRIWARGCAVLMGMHIVVRGTPPKPPFYLVSNHLAHLDSLLLCAVLGCLFIAKSEVASWPVLGFMARQIGAIFVDRSKRSDTVRVNELIGRVLAQGDGIAMFAESTTSRGLEIRPFKSALLEPAVVNKCPVHYATIHHQAPKGTPPASEWICWWRDEPFGIHILNLLGYRGFTSTVTFGDAPIADEDRKELARKLWEAAMAQFTPVE